MEMIRIDSLNCCYRVGGGENFKIKFSPPPTLNRPKYFEQVPKWQNLQGHSLS